jgi:hypothetical protein
MSDTDLRKYWNGGKELISNKMMGYRWEYIYIYTDKRVCSHLGGFDCPQQDLISKQDIIN